MQNEVDNTGIKALEEQDLGTVEVNPNSQEKVSAFPQFSDEAKTSRGLEDFKSLKKGMKQAIPYVLQLGADLVPGSGIAEVTGQQPDFVEGEKRPSYFEAFDRTVDYAKEGKTKEAIVSGVDTALTAIGGVGEGAMAASVLTGKFAPLIAGLGWGVSKLSDKGKLVLKSTKTGKEVLANFKRADTPEGDVKLDIKNVEIPKGDTSDEIKTLEDNIDIPTFRTDVKEQIKGYKSKKIFSDSDGTGYNYRGFQIRSFDDPYNPGKKNFNISEYDADGNVQDAFDASDSFKGAKDRVDELLFYENPNPAEMALRQTDEVSTVKQDVVEVEQPKQETPEVETSKQDADFIETKPVDIDAPKQDEGIKALVPKKIDYSPKEEIKDKGGFVFTDKKIEEMQQKLNVRLAKMAKGEKTAGEPSNKKIVLKSDNPDNPDFVVGDITPEEWVKRTNALVSKDKAMKAKDWYKKVYNYFLKVPGLKNEEEAKTLAQAWFASQQQASPREGLKNVLSIRQLLQEGKTAEDIMAMKSIPFGGTPSANSAILSVLVPGTEVKGVGSKISDFRDNLDGKNVRSILGNKKEGGSPFVVDVHTARDSGLVDPALINFLKAKGYKIPKDIKIDFAGMGVPTDKYENRSIWGQDLTKYVNEIKWLGKDDWKTEEVQAIGWTGLTDWYGGVNTGGDITSALEGSLQRISMEVAPGSGSPWDTMFGKDFSNLTPEKQIEINDKVTDEAIKMVSKSENVDLTSTVFGTGGWQTFINPSTIQQAILTRPKAKRVAAKLGMILNQTEVWVNSTKGLTKNPQNMAIDIIEEGSTNFKDSKFINDMFSDLFQKTNGLIEGFQPIETLGGEVGIRVIITKDAMKKFGKDNKLNLKQVQKKIENLDLNDLLKDYDFKMRYGILESELDILRNDWRKNKDGSDYKKNYISRGDDSRTSQDGKDFDTDKQKLTDIFREEIRNAQGTKRPDTEEVLVPEDIETENIPKKSIGGLVERNTYDWVYIDG